MKRKAEQILKVDVIGRVWTPRGQREAVLDEFERSGMAGTKFAEHIGVKYPTFASWVQKRRRERGATVGGLRGSGAPKALEWVEAAVETGRCRGGSVVLCVGHQGTGPLSTLKENDTRFSNSFCRMKSAATEAK